MSHTHITPTTTRQALRLGSVVRCTDGPAGVLSDVRFYPCCGALTHLVIHRSPWARPRRVVVPVADVAAITGAGVTLGVERAALNTLPADVPRSPGSTTGQHDAPQPVATCTQRETHAAVAVLRSAQPVAGAHRHGGRLAHVLVDGHTRRVGQLVIRHGKWRRRTIIVPLAWCDEIMPHQIRLHAHHPPLASLPPYHTDDEIVNAVRNGLRRALVFRARAAWLALGVAAHDGVVLLHGNVRSQVHKLEAERIAQHTQGVRQVCNELTTDDEVAQQIQRALHTHSRFQARNIGIMADLGLVTLAGEVDAPQQATRAVEIVRQVRGVQRINNLLHIVPHAERMRHAAVRDSIVVQRGPGAAAPDAVLNRVEIEQP